jgi:hypothetical protein
MSGVDLSEMLAIGAVAALCIVPFAVSAVTATALIGRWIRDREGSAAAAGEN